MKLKTIILTGAMLLGVLSGSSPVQAQNYLWAKNHGGKFEDHARQICTYSSGGNDYYYGVGVFIGFNTKFGSTSLFENVAGQPTPYLVKFDGLGNVIWAIEVHDGAEKGDHIAVACSTNGDVYVSGHADGTVTFDGSTTIGADDGYVAKFDPTGSSTWVIGISGALTTYPVKSLALDASGNVLAYGGLLSTSNSLTRYIGSGNLSLGSASNSGSGNLLLLKVPSTAASTTISSLIQGSGQDDNAYGPSISTDASDNIYIINHLRENISFNFGGCGTCSFITPPLNNFDHLPYILKLNSSGVVQWTKSLVHSGEGKAQAIRADDAGNTYVAATYSGVSATNTGGISLNPTGSYTIHQPFLTAINTSGTSQWADIGATSNAETYPAVFSADVIVDGCGYVYWSGFYTSPGIVFNGTAISKPDPIPPATYVVKCKALTGQVEWATNIQGEGDHTGLTVNSHHHSVAYTHNKKANFPSSVNQTLISALGTDMDVMIYSIEGPSIPAGSISMTPTCDNQPFGTITVNSFTGLLPPIMYNFNGNGFQTANTYSNLPWGNIPVIVQGNGGCTIQQNVFVPSLEDSWPKHPKTVSSSEASGYGVEVDLADGYYMTGSYRKDIEFEHFVSQFGNTANDITLSNLSGPPANDDGFLARYTSCGIDWAINIPGAADGEYGKVVNYESSNDAVLFGTNVFGPLPNGIIDGQGNSVTTSVNSYNLTTGLTAGVKKGLIISVDRVTGAINWVYVMGNNASEETEVTDIDIHSSGEVVAVGNFRTTYTYQGFNQHISNGSWDAVILQLNLTGGGYINSDFWGSTLEDRVFAVDISNVYRIYTTGFVSHAQVNLPGSNTAPAGVPNDLTDIFAVRFDNLLSVLNFRVHRSPGRDAGNDIKSTTVSPVDYMITGYFEEMISLFYTNIFTPPLNAPGFGPNNKDAFVAGFQASNDPQWLQIGVANGPNDAGQALSIFGLEAGNIGHYSDVPAGPPNYLHTLAPTGNPSDMDIYNSTFDILSGGQSSIMGQTGPGSDFGIDIASEVSIGAYITVGHTQAPGFLDFQGLGPITPLSNVQDVFMARLDQPMGAFFKNGLQEAIRSGEETISLPGTESSMEILSAFPNPVSAELFLNSTVDLDKVELFTMDGKCVLIREKIVSGSSTLSMQQLPHGVYILRAQSGSETYQLRIVKN